MRVYCYYVPIPLYTEESQRKLIDVWARSWSKQGWEPIVLNEGDAKLHPNYSKFKRHVWNLPTEYGHEYEGQCFLRWLAMAAQETDGGGGVLTDFDVINYGLKPAPVNPEEMYFLCDYEPHNTISMGVVIGAREHYEFFCRLFADWVPDKHDWNSHAGLFHCSDLSMVTRMFEDKTWKKPAWATKVSNVQAIFDVSRSQWNTAPLVHFGYNMFHAGYWPKHEHIERLRPF